MSKFDFPNYVKKYGSLVTFLVIEILLFTSLNLANYGIIYRYIGFFLAFALIPFPLLANKQGDWLDFFGLFLPLFVFAVFMVMSPLYSLYLEDILGNISILLGIVSFLFMGYALSKNKEFPIEKALMAIFGGLAALLGISFLITMYRYAPFYVVNYVGKVIYYDGEVYYIAEEAKWLYAFSIKEVNLAHFGLYSVVVSSVLGGLLFAKPKQKRKLDLFWLGIGVLGLLTIALLPNVLAAKWLLAPLAIMLLIRFYPRGKKAMQILNYVLLALAGVASAAALFFVLRSFGGPAIQNFISGNAILSKLLNNNRVYSFASVFGNMFSYPFGGLYDIYNSPITIVESTGSFLFDTLYQGGIFAFVGLTAFLVVAILSLVRYFKKGTDTPLVKGLIISFLLSFFIYSMFNYQYVQMIHELDLRYKSPFASDLLLLISVFLIGYTFTAKGTGPKDPLLNKKAPEKDHVVDQDLLY
ncbi:MAG: hypothetical protein NTV44_03145 [Firmicutes bacterium]|nr:hypothetical protein [Bacillota bacterium]